MCVGHSIAGHCQTKPKFLLTLSSKTELADKLWDIATNMEKEIDRMKKDDNCETEKEGDATEQFLKMESTT